VASSASAIKVINEDGTTISVVPESSKTANFVVVMVVSLELELTPIPCRVTSYAAGSENPSSA